MLAVTLPIFLLIGLGSLLARAGVLDEGGARSIGRFVATVALPALIFRLLVTSDPAALANGRYLAGYGGATLALMGAVYMIQRRTGRAPPAASVHAYGTASSNTGFIGSQLALQALGPAAAPAVALTLMVENLGTLPLLLALGSDEAGRRGVGERARVIALNLARSPLILAILAALVVLAVGHPLPAALARTVELLAGTASPLALVSIGAGLAALRSGALARPALTLAGVKLVVHPAAVFAGLHLAGEPPGAVRQAGVLLAAVSMAAVYPVFASPRGEGALAAAALFACTLLSFATLNIVLLLVGSGVLR